MSTVGHVATQFQAGLQIGIVPGIERSEQWSSLKRGNGQSHLVVGRLHIVQTSLAPDLREQASILGIPDRFDDCLFVGIVHLQVVQRGTYRLVGQGIAQHLPGRSSVPELTPDPQAFVFVKMKRRGIHGIGGAG